MWVLVITAVVAGHITTYKMANDPRERYLDYRECVTDLMLFMRDSKAQDGVKIYLSCEESTY